MYRTNDKSAFIESIQGYLLLISSERDEIPQSPVDGIYGNETRAAIEAFQKLFGIEITGTVDKETYDLLYGDAMRIESINKAKSEAYEEEKFPLSIGAFGHDVALLNTYLFALSEYYELGNIPTDDFFSKDTENSVSLMQKYFLEAVTGTVNYELLSRLKKEADIRKLFKIK
jgi:hypothetical protein